MEDSGIDSDSKPGCPNSAVKFKQSPHYSEDKRNKDLAQAETDCIIPSPARVRPHHLNLEDNRIGMRKTLNGNTYNTKKPISSNIIPIKRLPIPSKTEPGKENLLPLVQWDSDESEEDIHFFPPKRSTVRTELTDTFSVEELEVSADEADLELLPPKRSSRSYMCCPSFIRCVLM